MAKVVTVTWFPRTFINLFETYDGSSKIGLNIKDVDYSEKNLSFTIKGYGDYSDITFTQNWAGVHYFLTELPDEDILARSDKFMKDMEIVLLEKILKACHTVTYQQIVSDQMSLDFHTIVLTNRDIDTSDMTVKTVREVDLAYKPKDLYYGGTTLYVIGSEDLTILRPLLFYSTVEVVSDFISNMRKAMIRLSFDVGDVADRIASSKDKREADEQARIMNGIVDESISRYWKMKLVMISINSRIDEFKRTDFTPQERELVEALNVQELLNHNLADGIYIETLWGMMHDKVNSIVSMLNLKMDLSGAQTKKGWF
jgi:hypothetical protein